MNLGGRFRRWRRVLLSPLRFISGLFGSFNPVDLLVDAFSFPQHDWAKRLRRTMSEEETSIGWQQWVNPLFWMLWTIRFIGRWLATRPYTTLAPAIPAIFVTLMLVAMVVAFRRRDAAVTQTIYLDTLREAIASGEHEIASIAVQRLLAIDPQNLEHQYQLAMLDDELGKTTAARSAIFRLAVEKEYGPAALWMLKMLIYEQPGSELGEQPAQSRSMVPRSNWSDEEKKLCNLCAAVAMNKLPTSRANFAKRMYAGFLAENGDIGDALRLYTTIAEDDPSVNLAAALLASQQAKQTGDYLPVRRFAKAAVRHIEPTMLANPTSVETRLNLAQALVLDERDQEAFQLVLDGYKLTPDPRLKMAAGEAKVFSAERLKRDVGARETLAERGPIIFDALKLAPESPLVLEAVVQFSIECSEAKDQELIEVRKKLLSGVEPAAMHYIEGTVALMSGENEAAEHHLNLAAEKWGNTAGLLNNLAYSLISAGDEEKLPQALRLANAALQQLPGHPSLLETRGQVLLRLGRHRQAIVDLEGALEDPALRGLVHPALAQAYEALGVDDLAEEHRRLAERYGVSVAPSP